MTDRGKAWDRMGQATAGFSVLFLLLVLAAINDWSGILALFVGIALGVANAAEIREFFS